MSLFSERLGRTMRQLRSERATSQSVMDSKKHRDFFFLSCCACVRMYSTFVRVVDVNRRGD